MKVNDVKGGYAYGNVANGVRIERNDTSPNGFQNAFSDISKHQMKAKLQAMLEAINEQGIKLEKRTDLSEVLEYKRRVKEFLEMAIAFMFKFSRTEAVDRRGRRKLYSIIQLIDEELKALTEKVLDKERDHVAILEIIGDIKGLLINLMA